MSVGIVGLGLIGGSIALGLRDKTEVIGVDLDSQTRKIAQEKNICHIVTEDLSLLKETDVVFVAVPLDSVETVVKQLSHFPCVVADVGSLKYELSVELNDVANYIGTHPMAGREKGGISAASGVLFENALWVVDSTKDEALIARVTPYIEALGAYTFLLDPKTHDHMVGAVSHLPHLVAVALTLAVKRISQDDDRYFLMAAGGFRDTTRIASGDPYLWNQILTKSPYLKEAATVFSEVFSELAQVEDLTHLLNEACLAREKLPYRGKGVIGEVFSLVIEVVDRPGAIGEITSILAKEHINIKEIEILRQREGESGPLRLGFATSNKALEALELLEQQGYKVQARW